MVGPFKYLATTLTNQNSFQEEIKRKLKAGHAQHHSVQNLLSSNLIPKNIMIKICRTIILPVVLYGCENLVAQIEGEIRLGVFENRVLRRIFVPKRDEVTGEQRRLHNKELNDLYSSPIIIRMTKSRRMRWVEHVVHMAEM